MTSDENRIYLSVLDMVSYLLMKLFLLMDVDKNPQIDHIIFENGSWKNVG